jgi:hypothetical protein
MNKGMVLSMDMGMALGMERNIPVLPNTVHHFKASMSYCTYSISDIGKKFNPISAIMSDSLPLVRYQMLQCHVQSDTVHQGYWT